MNYPSYRRDYEAGYVIEREDFYYVGQGHKTAVKVRGEMQDVHNEYVVPYNPFLLWKYRCHINVEVVHSLTPGC